MAHNAELAATSGQALYHLFECGKDTFRLRRGMSAKSRGEFDLEGSRRTSRRNETRCALSQMR
jgi:hypothetical protein